MATPCSSSCSSTSFSSSTNTSNVNSDEPSLKCSICLELYTDPRVLPCLHTFCSDCISRQLGKNSSNHTLTCSQCRCKHEFFHYETEKAVSTLPVNTSILPQLKAAKAKLGGVKICGLCTSGDAAVAYCDECGEYLCDHCRNITHNRVKMFVGHQIRKISQKPLLLGTSLYETLNSMCMHHPENKLEVYCYNCKLLICCKCNMEWFRHEKHHCELMSDFGSQSVRNDIKQEIASLTESAISKEDKLKAYLDLVKKIEQVALTQQEDLRTKMKNFFDLLMEKLEDKFTEDNKKIWSTKNDLEILLSQINSSHSFSSHVQSLFTHTNLMLSVYNKIANGHGLSLVNQVLQCLEKINSTDMTSSMKELWNIESTSTNFQKSVLNLSNFLVLCSSEEKRKLVPEREQSDIQTPSNFTKGSSSTDKDINFIKVLKSTHPNTWEIIVTLDQPFAQCTDWEVRTTNNVNDTTVKVNQLSNNSVKVTIEVTGNAYYEFEFFQLIPSSNPSMSFDFTVTLTY